MRPPITPRRIAPLFLLIALGLQPLLASPTTDAEGAAEELWTLVRVPSLVDRSGPVLDVDVDQDVYRNIAGRNGAVVRQFPLPGRAPVDLSLSSFQVLSPAARLVAVDESGERDVALPEFHSFRGVVLGDPDSTVTLNLFDGKIAGSVRTGTEEFVIAPASFDSRDSGPAATRIWNREADPDRPEGPFCAGEAHAPHATDRPSLQPALPEIALGIDGDTMLSADIAIDATFEWFNKFGTLGAAQTYILNLMSQVTAIYESEVNVELLVSYLRVFTVQTDPYTDGTLDAALLLNELRTEWNLNQTAIDRTVVHLFSVRPSGGLGIAYIDVLCDKYEPGAPADYGVSTISANGGSWEKELVAHEFGHNFSSPHTHCFSPVIDQCANEAGCYQGPTSQTVGTIMSYCSNSDPVFHQRVEDEKIRPAAEAAYGICIGTQAPTVPPTQPQGLALY